MKKLIIATLGLLCATAIAVHAQEGSKPASESKPKKELTPEQQVVMKEMLAKYDANKNGKLDKEEKAAMSQEDKDKMAKVGLGKKKSSEAPKADAPKADAPKADAPKGESGK